MRVGQTVVHALGLPERIPNLEDWRRLIDNIDTSHEVIRIGMIGKYTELEDAYYSVNEALKTAGFFYQKRVKLEFLEAEDIEQFGTGVLEGLDGICIP